MAHTYDMANMDHRTSFALDELSIQRLKKLSSLWQVSQAEVVRRLLQQAESVAANQSSAKLRSLNNYHSQGGLAADKAAAWLAEVAEQRQDWGRKQ